MTQQESIYQVEERFPISVWDEQFWVLSTDAVEFSVSGRFTGGWYEPTDVL